MDPNWGLHLLKKKPKRKEPIEKKEPRTGKKNPDLAKNQNPEKIYRFKQENGNQERNTKGRISKRRCEINDNLNVARKLPDMRDYEDLFFLRASSVSGRYLFEEESEELQMKIFLNPPRLSISYSSKLNLVSDYDDIQ